MQAAIPLLLLALLTLPAGARADDPDSDGDGLSDFQEIHKYRTDPHKKDTAGQGVSDGDWQGRREHTYSVRAVLRVMPPYNLKALNDDYQDVRVLAQKKECAELEVVVYPLNANAEDIHGNPNWKNDYAGMRETARSFSDIQRLWRSEADLSCEVVGVHLSCVLVSTAR